MESIYVRWLTGWLLIHGHVGRKRRKQRRVNENIKLVFILLFGL